MSKHPGKIMPKVFLIVIMLAVMYVYSYAYIMANYGENAYQDPEKRSVQVNVYIVNGAGYFLKAYSDTLLLLNRVEMVDINGVNYVELQAILNNAVGSMENAKEAYTNLKQLADTTPYNPAMIDYLLDFDYNGFQGAYGLNASIFAQVESYLGRGDVNGFFGYLLTSTVDILEQLYKLKKSVDASEFPKIVALWRINQDFSEIMLCGQYAAKVFKNFIN
jgi:hypothetical protein